MRNLLFLFLLNFITLFAQPGPPPLYLTFVQDVNALLPLDTVPQVSVLLPQGPGIDGVTPRSLGPRMELYASEMFQDNRNSWRKFETNLYMNRKRVLRVIYKSDTMLLSIPMNEDSLRRCVFQLYRHGATIPVRFIPGKDELLNQLGSVKNNHLFCLLEDRFYFENPDRARRLRKAESCNALQSISRIVFAELSYQASENLVAHVTGQVQLDGDCDSSNALLGIYPVQPFKGAALSPCNIPQMDCGLTSTLWQDHKVVLPLKGIDPGEYKLVVCGIGEAYFQIIEN